MGSNKKTMVSILDGFFVINHDMIENNGEDSFAYSINERYAVFAAFDGCGGIGARKYDTYQNKTGAYIASHVSSEVLIEWFKQFSHNNVRLSGNSIGAISKEMQAYLTEGLQVWESGATASVIKGSLTKSFPTTASVILMSYEGDLNTAFIWAGDSRGYVLNHAAGLSQITTDDIEGDDDALSNLTNDSRLSNMVNATGDYKLNHRMLKFGDKSPAVLITATDGCFGYYSTPMEFEYMLLSTMQNSTNMEAWKKNIEREVREYAGDDYTMCVAVKGYNNFKTLKRLFEKRYDFMYDKYISKLENISDEGKVELWNEYKDTYYRKG